jgi:hypothetical protein
MSAGPAVTGGSAGVAEVGVGVGRQPACAAATSSPAANCSRIWSRVDR